MAGKKKKKDLGASGKHLTSGGGAGHAKHTNKSETASRVANFDKMIEKIQERHPDLTR